MNPEKVFKTKTGYCHVLPDKIVLTRTGVLGNIAELTSGNNIARPLIIYGICSIGLFYASAKGFMEGEVGTGAFFLIVGLLLVLGILKSIHNSGLPVIERSRIKAIEFKKAIPSITRAYFVVHFVNDQGKMKRRLIMLPGSLSGGDTETNKALQIMAEEFS